MKRKGILQTAFMLTAALLLLAGCTQDELSDGQGELLPEGKYPLTFTATQGEPVASPQTRVSDYDEGGNHKSKWTDGDQIKVAVSEGDNTMATTCTLGENGNVTGYDPKLYWKTTSLSKINAWYSNIAGQNTTSTTVSLADQSSGLAYVLKAEEKTGVNYKSGNISLNFKHQLAKVRVKLEKGTYEGDLSNASVKVKGYTTCTVTNGEVSNGGNEAYIIMHKNDDYYEANLVPQSVSATDFIKIIGKNDKEFAVTLTAGAPSALMGGQVYTFTVKVDKQEPLYVKLSDITTDQYTFDRDGTLEGDQNEYGKLIFIEDGVTLTIKNVKLKPTADGNAIHGNGTATLILDGENSLTGTGNYYAGVAAQTKIIIKGDGKLTAAGGTSAPGIGGGYYSKCGDILIEGGTITSTAGSRGGYPAAGIGSNCGDITITGGTITATGNIYSAGIGSGYGQYTGSITITGGTIVATKGDSYAESIGAGYAGGTGTITIDRGKADVTEN